MTYSRQNCDVELVCPQSFLERGDFVAEIVALGGECSYSGFLVQTTYVPFGEYNSGEVQYNDRQHEIQFEMMYDQVPPRDNNRTV
jgi:hypothetical protein